MNQIPLRCPILAKGDRLELFSHTSRPSEVSYFGLDVNMAGFRMPFNIEEESRDFVLSSTNKESAYMFLAGYCLCGTDCPMFARECVPNFQFLRLLDISPDGSEERFLYQLVVEPNVALQGVDRIPFLNTLEQPVANHPDYRVGGGFSLSVDPGAGD